MDNAAGSCQTKVSVQSADDAGDEVAAEASNPVPDAKAAVVVPDVPQAIVPSSIFSKRSISFILFFMCSRLC